VQNETLSLFHRDCRRAAKTSCLDRPSEKAVDRHEASSAGDRRSAKLFMMLSKMMQSEQF